MEGVIITEVWVDFIFYLHSFRVSLLLVSIEFLN